jgi:hypothetical protein
MQLVSLYGYENFSPIMREEPRLRKFRAKCCGDNLSNKKEEID